MPHVAQIISPRLVQRRLNFVRLASSARKSGNQAVFDTSLLESNPELVISHMKSRGNDENIDVLISKITSLRHDRYSLLSKGNHARHERKILSEQIRIANQAARKDEITALKGQVAALKEDIAVVDVELQRIESEIQTLFLNLPNLVDDRVPDGVSSEENTILSTWGADLRELTLPHNTSRHFYWHDELAEAIGGLNNNAAVGMSGARFSVLVGHLAQLERALINYCLDTNTSHGYTAVSVPYIVNSSSLQNTGQLPKFHDDLFALQHSVHGESGYLIPTAEVPVMNIYRSQLLSPVDLPIRHVCYTPCFRSESSSHGRDKRGLLRQHQFHKVELVSICEPSSSQKEHERVTASVESLLQQLRLPYRKVLLCSGDLGFAARICYDIEVWMPGQQEYREVSSISNCYEFQSRRMGLRYKTKGSSGSILPHSINGSGLAIGRTLVAILENYQQEDGSVVIPEVLLKYMNGIKVLHPVKPIVKYTGSSS